MRNNRNDLWSRDLAAFILSVGTRWVICQLHAPANLSYRYTSLVPSFLGAVTKNIIRPTVHPKFLISPPPPRQVSMSIRKYRAYFSSLWPTQRVTLARSRITSRAQTVFIFRDQPLKPERKCRCITASELK